MTRIKNEDGWLCLGNLIFVPSVVSIGKYKTEAPDIKPQKVAIAMPMLRMRMKIVSRSNRKIHLFCFRGFTIYRSRQEENGTKLC